MAVITLGHQSDYGSSYAAETWVSDTATANGTGTIDNIEAYTGSGAVSAATASGSGGSYTVRSYDDTLTATTGFNQWQAPTDFTAFDVVSGDVGAIYTAGALHYTTGGDSIYYAAGDQITGGGGFSLGSSGSYTFSLYMSGSDSAGVSGTIAVTLSSFTSSITGQRGHQGTIAQTLSSFTSSIQGSKTVQGTISQTLASFTSAITGTKTIIGTLAQTLADFTSSLAGGVGKIGTIARTLGAFLSEILGDGFLTIGSWKDRLIGNRYRHASHYVTTGRRRNRNNG
jgi:hypothetical protein